MKAKRPGTTITYLRVPTRLRNELVREANRRGWTITQMIELILNERYAA